MEMKPRAVKHVIEKSGQKDVAPKNDFINESMLHNLVRKFAIIVAKILSARINP